jgi:hypothetical protein
VFCFFGSLCTLVIKVNCCSTSCRAFCIYFFLAGFTSSWFSELCIKIKFCYFSLVFFLHELNTKEKKIQTVELHHFSFFFNLFFVCSTFLFFYFVWAHFEKGFYVDVHFFSFTMKRCYLGFFFHVDFILFFTISSPCFIMFFNYDESISKRRQVPKMFVDEIVFEGFLESTKN